MSGRRLVLVSRRFWPLVGGAEMVMANLATEFRELGCAVHILTAQWEPHWPRELVHREIPVTRLPHPQRRGWGTFCYMCALSRWLRRHRREFDGVLVSMLKHCAYSALGARHGAAVVLRAEGGGVTGDCHWQRTGNFGGRIRTRCLKAPAVVAPGQGVADELLAAGYAPERVHFIPNGVRLAAADPTGERKIAARRTLADANIELTVPDGSPLAVFTGRLDRRKGLFDLVRAWRDVVMRWPQARLWLIGEGADREPLWQLIRELDLRGRVLMPGAFDQVDDLLRAADLFVLPSYEEGMSLALLEAMGSGVPVVASDIPGNRALVEHERTGLLAPVGDSTAWAAAIERLAGDPVLSLALGGAGRRLVAEHYSLRRCAESHLAIFERLLAESSSPGMPPSHATAADHPHA